MTQLELWQKTEKKELLRKLLMHRSQSELKPVSSVQSDLLKRQFRFPNEINSNIYGTVSADYKLEPAKIEQILNELANTHEFFRTRFSWNHGYPVYTLDTTTNINDLLSVHEVHDPKEAQEKIDHFLQTPMEVFSGPPIRFLISNIFPNHSFFTVVTHHCLLDGDALFRLLQIIGYHYQNSTPQKPKKDTDQTYANFVAQETLDILRGAPKALSRLQTWLTDLSPSQFTPNYSLGLRKDCRPEPILRRIQKSEFTLVHTLNSESYRRFSTFLWLWAKHLKIWYHLENLAIAIPHTRRFTGSHHHILGSMADYFPLFITNNHCPNEEIRNIDCQLINIIDGHQDSSFSFLQRLVEREHGSIHRHLSQTVFDYQDFSRIEELQKDFKFIEGGRLGLPPGTELSLSIREFNSELFVRLDYNKNLFCPWDMEKLVDHFIQKLSGTRENTTFGENLPPIAKNIPDSLPNLSTRIATNLPHLSPSIITDQNQVWTSEKLQEEILRWKRTFHNLKLCAGDIVSVSLDRSCEYISIVIAIWDLGGIYLPIDSNAPLNRITQMLKESGTRFFVAAQESLDPEKLKILVPSLIYLDPKKSPPIATLEKIQSYPLGSQAPAYILYTSGSTGRPKGAMVHHGGLDNHTQAFTQYFHITSQDIIAQTASVLFDISVWQLTQFAWTGAQTVILADEVVSDPLQLLPALHRHAVTIAELTPTQLKLALSCAENPPPLKQLRHMILIGESLTPDLCAQWYNRYPYIPLTNAYGPAECSHAVTLYTVANKLTQDKFIPIGQPMLNCEISLIDDKHNQVPPGAIGEIQIKGPSVGLGYLNNQDETKRAFEFKDHKSPTNRSYLTGDLGRLRRDGKLEFIRRKDHQFKIQGHRIEPEEIEVLCRSFEHVTNAGLGVSNINGHRELVIFLTLSSEKKEIQNELTHFINRDLPIHLRPKAINFVMELPKLASGKLNRRALNVKAEEILKSIVPQDFELYFENETEEIILRQWCQQLRIKKASNQDNFFELGGDSILASKIIENLNHLLEKELPIAIIFQAQSAQALATAYQQKESGQYKLNNKSESRAQKQRTAFNNFAARNASNKSKKQP